MINDFGMVFYDAVSKVFDLDNFIDYDETVLINNGFLYFSINIPNLKDLEVGDYSDYFHIIEKNLRKLFNCEVAVESSDYLNETSKLLIKIALMKY